MALSNIINDGACECFSLNIRETIYYIDRNRYNIYVKVDNCPFYVYIRPTSYHISLTNYISQTFHYITLWNRSKEKMPWKRNLIELNLLSIYTQLQWHRNNSAILSFFCRTGFEFHPYNHCTSTSRSLLSWDLEQENESSEKGHQKAISRYGYLFPKLNDYKRNDCSFVCSFPWRQKYNDIVLVYMLYISAVFVLQ